MKKKCSKQIHSLESTFLSLLYFFLELIRRKPTTDIKFEAASIFPAFPTVVIAFSNIQKLKRRKNDSILLETVGKIFL